MLSAPSAEHFGTDDAGRDIWARLVWGLRSLGIGVASMTIAVVVGTLLGVISGYYGGLVDAAMQRLLDALQAFPPSSSVDRQRVRADGAQPVLAFGFIGMTQVSRLVRSKVDAARVAALRRCGRVIGASDICA
jgi:peptide/nickel transport system permease protein